MTDGKPSGKLLICENDQGLRESFMLMLGGQYEILFANTPTEIVPLLNQHGVRHVVWHLDRPKEPFAEQMRQALLDNDPLETSRNAKAAYLNGCLQILKAVRQRYPALRVLLLARERDYGLDFQLAALKCGSVNFLPDTWESSKGFAEQLQVLFGDKKNSIRHWVVRIPKA